MANEEQVGQILFLMHVANDLPPLYGSFATFDMRKLVILQVEADDTHDILDTSLIHLQYFGVHIRRWSALGFVHNVPKLHRCQQHFGFELSKVEVPSIKLIITMAAAL